MRITSAKLYTREGGFVTDIEIPPFDPPADVVIWGARTFVFDQPILSTEPHLRYREGMAWHHNSDETLTKIAREAFAKASGTDR